MTRKGSEVRVLYGPLRTNLHSDMAVPQSPDGLLAPVAEVTALGEGAPTTAAASRAKRRSPRHRRPRRFPQLRAGHYLVTAALMVQLAILLVLTLRKFDTYAASVDFSIHFQAWFQIAHGHFNPVATTVYGYYWKDLGEFITWPLALLYWVWPNDGLTLLVLQDLAIVAGTAVAVAWIVALARRRGLGDRMTATCVAAALVLFVANPWIYTAIIEDFHFESLTAVFILGAGFALWAGRRRAMWILVVLALSTGILAGTYLAPLGIAFAVTTPRCRRDGLFIAGAGLAWSLLLGKIGVHSRGFAGYAYLAGHALSSGPGAAPAILSGALTHPMRPVRELWGYRYQIVDNLVPTGFLGLFNPWMWGPILTILLMNGLDTPQSYISPGFQNTPLYLFGITGTVLTAVLLVGWHRLRARAVSIALALAVAGSLAFSFFQIDQGILPYPMTASVGSELAAIRAATPASAEVISAFGVVGRYSGRPWVYVMWNPGMTFPVESRDVVFVLVPVAGNEPLPAGTMQHTIGYVAALPHSRPLLRGPDAWGYLWHPPRGVDHVTLPSS